MSKHAELLIPTATGRRKQQISSVSSFILWKSWIQHGDFLVFEYIVDIFIKFVGYLSVELPAIPLLLQRTSNSLHMLLLGSPIPYRDCGRIWGAVSSVQ